MEFHKGGLDIQFIVSREMRRNFELNRVNKVYANTYTNRYNRRNKSTDNLHAFNINSNDFCIPRYCGISEIF